MTEPKAAAEAAAPAGKRKPGRPPRTRQTEVRQTAPTTNHRHRLRPLTEYPRDDSSNRLHIPQEMFPDGFDLQWVSSSVYGQPQKTHRASFERKGWVPVLADDFDGRFDGRYMPAGQSGEINVEGLVLMARPMEWTLYARQQEKKEARRAVAIKEQQIRGGEIEGISEVFDAKHPKALAANVISKQHERVTPERLDVPE
jgi:hypothetical protein